MPSISLICALAVAFIGFWGVCFRQKTITFLFVSLEVVLAGFGMIFCLLSTYFFDGSGFLMGLAIVTVTAVEAALGLGLLVVYYNLFQTSSATQMVTYLRAG